MSAIALLPQDHYVKFGKELDEEEQDEQDEQDDEQDDEGSWFLTATVFQKAPEDGWPSRGAYFRHSPPSPSHEEECPPQWRHNDSVIFGVTAGLEEPEILERLLINAITRQWSAA